MHISNSYRHQSQAIIRSEGFSADRRIDNYAADIAAEGEMH
jgi:hypothetical protein